MNDTEGLAEWDGVRRLTFEQAETILNGAGAEQDAWGLLAAAERVVAAVRAAAVEEAEAALLREAYRLGYTDRNKERDYDPGHALDLLGRTTGELVKPVMSRWKSAPVERLPGEEPWEWELDGPEAQAMLEKQQAKDDEEEQ